jgi:hypothetical protein
MRGVLPVALAVLMLAWPLTTQTQATDYASVKNARPARASARHELKLRRGPFVIIQRSAKRPRHRALWSHE